MAENVTDDQVEESRKRVDELRAEIAEEQRKQAQANQDGENAVRKERLDRQADQFEAELRRLRGNTSDQSSAPAPTAESSEATKPTTPATSSTPPDTASKAEDDKE